MEEAEMPPDNVELTPEEELDEEQIFSEASDLKLSEEKQKKVLLKYIQEKRELLDQLQEKEKELKEYKARVYDLTNQNEALKKSSGKGLANRASGMNPRSPVPQHKSVVNIKTPATRRAAKSKKKKTKNIEKIGQQDSFGSKTSVLVDATDNADSNEKLKIYKEIAHSYPELKFSVILEAEKVFNEADINHDGTIDEDELEKLLEKQGHYMTTKKEVKEIMKDVDKDDTGTIDLMEYMAVMERVQMRKRTKLPPHLTKTSAVCAIQ